MAFRSRKVRQCHFTISKILYLIAIEFHDLWHSLKVPNDVDLLRQLASGKLCSLLFAWLTLAHDFPEGLQVTAAETAAPKAPTTKKKGKKGGAPRQRQVRITNTHLKGEIDLQKDYAAHQNTNPH